MIILYIIVAGLVGAGLSGFTTKYMLEKQYLNKNNAELKTRTALIRAASHELRTPLNDILGLVDTLKSEFSQLSTKGQKVLGKLGDSGGALHQLLLDVLEIFDLSNKNIVFENTVFNVTELMRTNIQILENKLNTQQPGLKFEFSTHEDIWINADRVRFNQCFRALLDQAAYQTKNGTVTIEVQKNSMENSEKTYLNFEIYDESPGMDQYQAEKYFVPDEYEMNPTLRGRPSAMLALNLAKGIIEMMGGMVQVTSRVGSGVTFKWNTIVGTAKPLPAPQITENSAPLTISSPHEKKNRSAIRETEDVQLTGANILIIDDNETNLMVLEGFLELFDPAHILKATGGRAAIEIAKQVNCDLIFTDIQMPDLDGYETTKRLKGLSAHYLNVPIVAISAGSKFENIPKCKAAGMMGYVEKPLSKRALMDTINGIGLKVQKSVQDRAA